jgi:hypothetical protein
LYLIQAAAVDSESFRELESRRGILSLLLQIKSLEGSSTWIASRAYPTPLALKLAEAFSFALD